MDSHAHHDHDSHAHAHGHGHHHAVHAQDFSRAFLIGIVLNCIYIIIELGYGFFSNSLALIADAGHNFSDVVGLVLSWTAIKLAGRKATEKFTYGFKRGSILASLANSVLLLLSVGIILFESVRKLIHPEEVQSTTMIIVASVGVAINFATALLFLKGRHQDLNIKSAYVHMAADAALSLGVVIAGVIIQFTHWNILDPIMSIIISLVIIAGTWEVLNESLALAVDAVPDKVEPQSVKKYLESIDGVAEVHDLHIWGMSTTEVALTAHLVLKENVKREGLLSRVRNNLKKEFSIDHSTIQLESKDETPEDESDPHCTHC